MNKGDADQFGAVLGIFLLIFIVYYIYQNSEASYSISLQNNQIPRGQDIVLFYKVSNSFKEDISDVKINYWIIDNTGQLSNYIGNISKGGTSQGNIKIQTNGLYSGKYTVATNLTYMQNNILQSGYLTLGFEVF